MNDLFSLALLSGFDDAGNSPFTTRRTVHVGPTYRNFRFGGTSLPGARDDGESPSPKWMKHPLSIALDVGESLSMFEAIDRWENEGGATHASQLNGPAGARTAWPGQVGPKRDHHAAADAGTRQDEPLREPGTMPCAPRESNPRQGTAP